MKKPIIILAILLGINSSILFAQVNLTIEGTVTNNSTTGSWNGINIQRTVPTTFIYRNNSVTSVNTAGYMLQAGDESVSGENNNLDGEVISGNKLVWNGTDASSITHGIFTGHNKNVIIKYNYLDKVPMAIIRKSTNNMTNSSGGVSYNIVKNPVATAGVVKGMNNVSYYNNTFYSSLSSPWRGLVDIYTNTDITPSSPATGAKIKNNIFYTVNQIYNIAIHDAGCLPGFESDYNVFYCESGTPVFNYLESKKTFAQWQALGYDKHSTVINPNFINTVDFVPASRLDYGTDLGTAWQTGLSTSAGWVPGTSPSTANQNGTWQAGARVYNTAPANPAIPKYIGSVIENAAPSVLVMTFNLDLATSTPSISAFTVQINSVERKVNSIAIIGSKVSLTLASPAAFGDAIKVSYAKPASNPLQTTSGGQAASFSAQVAVNNIIAQTPDPAPVTLPGKLKMTVYPNPAHLIINIRLENDTMVESAPSRTIRVFDISGKLFMEKMLENGVSEIVFPLTVKPGIYIVILLSDNVEIASQNIVIY